MINTNYNELTTSREAILGEENFLFHIAILNNILTYSFHYTYSYTYSSGADLSISKN